MKSKNLTGQRFGRLIVVAPTDKRNRGRVVWLCKCDCGNKCFVPTSSLCSGRTQSCGCLMRERASEANTTHGAYGTPEYRVWASMKDRCNNPNCKEYCYYGGRKNNPIKVCECWYRFENFFKDMGFRPDGLTLERLNNNLGYSKENCSWENWHTQRLNQRQRSDQHWFYGHGPNGEMIVENNQSEVARCFNLDRGTISACLRKVYKSHKGWTFQWI